MTNFDYFNKKYFISPFPLALAQIMYALHSLHKVYGIIQNDIYPGNFLINYYGQAKLADFGESFFIAPDQDDYFENIQYEWSNLKYAIHDYKQLIPNPPPPPDFLKRMTTIKNDKDMECKLII